VAQYVYILGAAGERLKVEELDRTVEYEYDELYRLTKETVTDENGTTVTSYTYDRNSNRLTKNTDGELTSYTYNELNKLVSETGISYVYDLNGNLKTKTEAEQTTTYTYNSQNRLIRVTIQSGQQVNVEEYLYDFAGNRIAKATELSTVYYLIDTNGALSQVLAEYDENGSLTVNYMRGAELISQERNGVKLYYLYDGHDSVRKLTNEDGIVTDTYEFDAFGNLTASTGDTVNTYLYCGEQFDGTTGLYYLRARYMNPATGTFISMDTYQGSIFEPVSLHKYLYANANPVMNCDPSGYSVEGTLGNQVTVMVVMTILASVVMANYSGYIDMISFALTEISNAIIITCDMIAEWTESITSGILSSSDITSDIKDKASEDSTDADTDGDEEDTGREYPGDDPSKSPGEGWKWRGKGNPEDGKGNWTNPDTGESLHPDLKHPEPYGPHWDYKSPNGDWYRIFPDGTMNLK
jgi:RHS repeat-associated protein